MCKKTSMTVRVEAEEMKQIKIMLIEKVFNTSILLYGLYINIINLFY